MLTTTTRPAARAVAGVAEDGKSAWRLIEATAPDVILLDISMPGLDGVALACRLAACARRPGIVFVTAFDHYAVVAFELAVSDYLLKPVSLPRLQVAIDRAAEASRAGPNRHLSELLAPHGREMVRVGAEALDLLEAERDYVRLHTRGRAYLLRSTLGDLERRLDPARFVRAHRSAIIAIDRIRAVRTEPGGAWTMHLLGGRHVRVGRSFRQRVRALAAPAWWRAAHVHAALPCTRVTGQANL